MKTNPIAVIAAPSFSVVSGSVVAQPMAMSGGAAAHRGGQTTLGADHFAAGNAVQIDKPVAGDLCSF